MKYGQILVCFMANISNMILAQYWRLKTSSRFFYDFTKMTTQRDPAIFNSRCLPFLTSLIHLFKNMKHRNLEITGY